jgi:hypothetical protein
MDIQNQSTQHGVKWARKLLFAANNCKICKLRQGVSCLRKIANYWQSIKLLRHRLIGRAIFSFKISTGKINPITSESSYRQIHKTQTRKTGIFSDGCVKLCLSVHRFYRPKSYLMSKINFVHIITGSYWKRLQKRSSLCAVV